MAVRSNFQEVYWKEFFQGNMAQPRALLVIWLDCHKRLATKDKLHMFGMANNVQCYF